DTLRPTSPSLCFAHPAPPDTYTLSLHDALPIYHEATTRRWYGGAIGFIGFDGSMNTGLTLRTAQIRDGVAAVRAGATLLFDSDPEAEERETELKASALLGALAAVGQPETVTEEPPREQPGLGMKVLLDDHEYSFVNTLADYFRQ